MKTCETCNTHPDGVCDHHRAIGAERTIDKLNGTIDTLTLSLVGAIRERDEARAFLRRTAMTGGSIVSSAAMTATQIAIARAADRMLVTPDGYGFVYIPGPRFCACGRVESDCDQSRASCPKGAARSWKVEALAERIHGAAVRDVAIETAAEWARSGGYRREEVAGIAGAVSRALDVLDARRGAP